MRVDANNSNRGRFSVPVDFDEVSVNLNVERIIDTEQETNAEPLLSSLTREL